MHDPSENLPSRIVECYGSKGMIRPSPEDRLRKRKKPAISLAIQTEETGFERPSKSLRKPHVSNKATHKATHGPTGGLSQRALDELIALWPNLSLATQNRIYELVISETSEKSVRPRQ